MAERIREKETYSCVDCQNSVYVQYMFVGQECQNSVCVQYMFVGQECQNSVCVQYMFVGQECQNSVCVCSICLLARSVLIRLKKTVATDPRPPDVRNE